MEEIVNLVAQRAGLSTDDARKAVEVIVDLFKQRLPGPLASHVDSFLTGGVSGAAGGLGEQAGDMLKGALGNFFGGKK